MTKIEIKIGHILRVPKKGMHGVIRGYDGKDYPFGTGDIRDTEIEFGMTSPFDRIVAHQKIDFIVLPNGRAKIIGFY